MDDYKFDYDKFAVNSPNEADDIKKWMQEIIKEYGFVTVADPCDMICKASSYTDIKYGWTNVDDAKVVRVTNGYGLKLPDPVRIDRPIDGNRGAFMPEQEFQSLLDELDGNSLETLKTKNARYSSNGDALHNFRSGADICGGTPAQACWGYLTKHLVALRDMVQRDDFSNREDFLEKCQDSINYIRFLWCIGNDNKNNKGD